MGDIKKMVVFACKVAVGVVCVGCAYAYMHKDEIRDFFSSKPKVEFTPEDEDLLEIVHVLAQIYANNDKFLHTSGFNKEN